MRTLWRAEAMDRAGYCMDRQSDQDEGDEGDDEGRTFDVEEGKC